MKPNNDARPHSSGDGLLVVNLGTPAAPTASAVRRYLAEFLGDPRVVELPRLLWYPVLYGVILPLRGMRSAAAYRRVWTDQGSPLLVESQQLTDGLSHALPDMRVALAMRYGEPSIPRVLSAMNSDGGLRRLFVLPLYPQYSATTTATVFDAVSEVLRGWRRIPELRFLADYHDDASWLEAAADSVRAHWEAKGRGEHLLFSFHGLPQRYADAGDPYPAQCVAGAEAIASRLGLERRDWSLSYQSRVGREPWLQPYTDLTLDRLAADGVKRIDVVCPGFAVDCLETLEEIAIENAERFHEKGGETLNYIPCLNAAPAHVAALAALVRRQTADWQDPDGAA
ncbi:MAG: ferrochelatase [Rhodanobacteraceae bacterium]|nr:ferrochelatase [Xanthomonadales bacterium]MCP5479645.1 ferrochelatase [Rhodanobacteraceae bacterium]